MTDEEKVKEGTSSRGNEWEVVSLTASAYNAAPGPNKPESTSADKELAQNEVECSQAMFMSGHFVFPPSEHENLPLEPDTFEMQTEAEPPQLTPSEDKVGGHNKIQEEMWNLKVLSETSELHQSELYEKGKKLSDIGMKVGEAKELQGLNLVGDEQGICSDAEFSSFHRNADISESVAFDETTDDVEPDDSWQPNLDSPPDLSKTLKPIKAGKYNGFPSEAWWKRQAASLYAQAKEANTFWSIFVAAALMGLVILGRRWQQDRRQIQQLSWKLSNHDEKIHRVLGPISRFKDVFIGTHRRGLGGIGSFDN